MRSEKRITFVVPATAGNYAPEVLECRQQAGGVFDFVEVLSIAVESLPAGAQIEVDVLKGGVNKQTPAAADWLLNQAQATATGFYNPLNTAGWRGVRLRAKSGGTAGDAVVTATWRADDS